MKKSILLVVLVFAVLSCKNNNTNENLDKNETPDKTENIKETSLIEVGCYSFNNGKDSISFEITKVEDQVSGNLSYWLYEKDSNTGTFSGKLKDNVLFGDYTFNSEGVQSTREVAFKVKNDELVEGYGKMNNAGNAFKDKKTIEFTSTLPLKKTDCNN